MVDTFLQDHPELSYELAWLSALEGPSPGERTGRLIFCLDSLLCTSLFSPHASPLFHAVPSAFAILPTNGDFLRDGKDSFISQHS